MPRLKCIVEYDGTHFVGWQRQLNGRSVQEAIEQAIEKIAEKKTTIFGAGRTDTGVHAISNNHTRIWYVYTWYIHGIY